MMIKKEIERKLLKLKYPITLLNMQEMPKGKMSPFLEFQNGIRYISYDFYKPISRFDKK